MTNIQLIDDLAMTLRGILVYHFFLKRSCNWNKKRIESYQFKKLKKLLIECGENVPYYKQLFGEINFDPKTDFKDLGDLNKIPVLTKAIAKKNRHLLNNPKYFNKSIEMRTSGSTGEPFHVNVSKNAWVMEQAVVWRHWKWSGYNFRDKMAIVRSYVPGENGSLYKKDKLKNFIYFSPFHLNDQVMGQYLDKMVQEKVRALRGYPSTILILANYVLNTNHEIPNLKLILVASEELRYEDRYIIEKAFRTKVTNHYGLAEVSVMMGDCAAHNGMHNYDEHAYLELIDTDDKNLKRIIGTNLHNYATPLIRYDTGDLAQMESKEDRPSCAHNLTTVQNIKGRADTHIKTPEGYSIATVNFYTLFESYQEVVKWQIIQKSIDELEVCLLSNDITDSRVEQIRSDFYKRIPKSMMLTILINEPFVQKYEGKINSFISMIEK